MTTTFRVVAIVAALTLVCSNGSAQNSPHLAPKPTDPAGESIEYEGNPATEEVYAPDKYRGSCESSQCGGQCGGRCGGHCGDQCGCVVGTAMHVGYPRCFNFRSPCAGGGACGCGSIFGELLCDVRDWGVRMRSYRVASCSTAGCSVCGAAEGGCTCAQFGAIEPSCDGNFEPGCGMVADDCGCGRSTSWCGGLSCLSGLFGGHRNSSGCQGCCGGGTCSCGSPRDAAAYGNSWYPAHGGESYSLPAGSSGYPQGGSIQEAPMEPIPAAQGSVSGYDLPGRGRKSIHYYTQAPASMSRPMPVSTPPHGIAAVPQGQIARRPATPPAAIAPSPSETVEPEVRVRDEIPTAPNTIRRMSFEFGARAMDAPPARTADATVRFADDQE